MRRHTSHHALPPRAGGPAAAAAGVATAVPGVHGLHHLHQQRAPPARLPALLSALFLHLLPSILFGLVALLLDEAARFIDRVAAFFRARVPPAAAAVAAASAAAAASSSSTSASASSASATATSPAAPPAVPAAAAEPVALAVAQPFASQSTAVTPAAAVRAAPIAATTATAAAAGAAVPVDEASPRPPSPPLTLVDSHLPTPVSIAPGPPVLPKPMFTLAVHRPDSPPSPSPRSRARAARRAAKRGAPPLAVATLSGALSVAPSPRGDVAAAQQLRVQQVLSFDEVICAEGLHDDERDRDRPDQLVAARSLPALEPDQLGPAPLPPPPPPDYPVILDEGDSGGSFGFIEQVVEVEEVEVEEGGAIDEEEPEPVRRFISTPNRTLSPPPTRPPRAFSPAGLHRTRSAATPQGTPRRMPRSTTPRGHGLSPRGRAMSPHGSTASGSSPSGTPGPDRDLGRLRALAGDFGPHHRERLPRRHSPSPSPSPARLPLRSPSPRPDVAHEALAAGVVITPRSSAPGTPVLRDRPVRADALGVGPLRARSSPSSASPLPLHPRRPGTPDRIVRARSSPLSPSPSPSPPISRSRSPSPSPPLRMPPRRHSVGRPATPTLSIGAESAPSTPRSAPRRTPVGTPRSGNIGGRAAVPSTAVPGVLALGSPWRELERARARERETEPFGSSDSNRQRRNTPSPGRVTVRTVAPTAVEVRPLTPPPSMSAPQSSSTTPTSAPVPAQASIMSPVRAARPASPVAQAPAVRMGGLVTARLAMFEDSPEPPQEEEQANGFVSERVNRIEHFLAETGTEVEGEPKVPMPPTSVLCAIYASEFPAVDQKEFASSLPEKDAVDKIVTDLKLAKDDVAKLDFFKDDQTESEDFPQEQFTLVREESVPKAEQVAVTEAKSQPPSEKRASNATMFFSEDGGSSTGEIRTDGAGSALDPKSADVHTLLPEPEEPELDFPPTPSTEAPAPSESLQELIPDAREEAELPSRGSQLFLGESTESETAPDESMEGIPPLWLREPDSAASLRTESYSSPSSPPPTQNSSSTTKTRQSLPAGDQDLFSEEPSMTCETIERHVANMARDHSDPGGDYVDSPTPPGQQSVIHEQFIDIDQDSETFEMGLTHVQSYGPTSSMNNDSESGSESDEDSSVFGAIDARNWDDTIPAYEARNAKRRLARNGKSKRNVPEDLLFRQASIDIPAMQTGRLFDRPKPEGGRNLPKPSKYGYRDSKVPVISRPGRPSSTGQTGRSLSSNERRYEAWPEYTPSQEDDSTQISRRHASDMSFGVMERQADMLPPELLVQDDVENTPRWHGESGVSDRRGWRMRFGRGSGHRDSHRDSHRESTEVRSRMRNLLRIRRKTNASAATPTTGTSENAGTTVGSSSESSHRRSGAGGVGGGDGTSGGTMVGSGSGSDRELRFESELDQETVFSLLNRICPECGFRISVRRGNHKMKVEVPCGGDMEPLLVSIVLSKVGHGRGTMVALMRSKEDISRGPAKDIESAATLLRKRLEAHVEFIEDSFASLYLDSSNTDMESRLGHS